MTSPKPFKTLLTQKLVSISGLSLLISSLLTLIVTIILISTSADREVNNFKRLSLIGIDEHLSTGWTDKNVIDLFHQLQSFYPNYTFSLIKSPQRDQVDRQKISVDLQHLLSKIETQQTSLSEIHLSEGTILGGYPFYFEPRCMKCHQGTAKLGEHAGTLMFKTALTGYRISFASALLFAFIFAVSFLVLAIFQLHRFLNSSISQPLTDIASQLNALRLDENIEWQHSTNMIAEIDQIHQQIHQNIIQFKNIHDKLDAVRVTEHETGFFLANHFKEAVKFEIYRCERYDRVFSIITLKLHSIRDLAPEQKRSMPQKLLEFAKATQKQIRNSDMPFRIAENLFIILAPELNESEVMGFEHSLIERFQNDESTHNELKLIFEVSIGYATYKYDALDTKGLTHIALERMTAAKTQPSYSNKEELQNTVPEHIPDRREAAKTE